MMMRLKSLYSFVIRQKNRQRKILKQAENAVAVWLPVAMGRCARMVMLLPHASTSPSLRAMNKLCANVRMMATVDGRLRQPWGDAYRNCHHLDFLCLNTTTQRAQKTYTLPDQKLPLSCRVLKLSYTRSVRGVFILIESVAWGGHPGFRLI